VNHILNLSGELRNKDIEKQFRSYAWPFYSRTIIPLSLLIIFSAIALNMKNILLFNITPQLKIFLIIDSIIFTSGFFVIIFSLINKLIKSIQYISILLFLAAGLHNTAEIILNKTPMEGYYFIALIGITMIFYIFFRYKLINTIISSLLLSTIHLYLIYKYMTPDVAEIVSQTTILAFVNLLGTYVFLRINSGERKKFLYKTMSEKNISELNEDIKKLRTEVKEKNNQISKLEEKLKKNLEKNCTQSFEELVKTEFDRSKRYNQDLAIVLLKINNLNQIIQNSGKKAAMLIINKVNEICKKTIRPGDSVFKSDNQKFEFILPSTDEYGAVSFAERVKDNIAKYKYVVDGKKIVVGLSTGIACYEDEKEYMELIKASEEALIKALKRSSKESVFI